MFTARGVIRNAENVKISRATRAHIGRSDRRTVGRETPRRATRTRACARRGALQARTQRCSIVSRAEKRLSGELAVALRAGDDSIH